MFIISQSFLFLCYDFWILSTYIQVHWTSYSSVKYTWNVSTRCLRLLFLAQSPIRYATKCFNCKLNRIRIWLQQFLKHFENKFRLSFQGGTRTKYYNTTRPQNCVTLNLLDRPWTCKTGDLKILRPSFLQTVRFLYHKLWDFQGHDAVRLWGLDTEMARQQTLDWRSWVLWDSETVRW